MNVAILQRLICMCYLSAILQGGKIDEPMRVMRQETPRLQRSRTRGTKYFRSTARNPSSTACE